MTERSALQEWPSSKEDLLAHLYDWSNARYGDYQRSPYRADSERMRSRLTGKRTPGMADAGGGRLRWRRPMLPRKAPVSEPGV